MPTEITSILVAEGQGDAFERAFARCRHLLLEVEGCGGAALQRCIENPRQYQVHVRWRTLTDHTQVYAKSAQAVKIRALLGPLIEKAEMKHFEVVSTFVG